VQEAELSVDELMWSKLPKLVDIHSFRRQTVKGPFDNVDLSFGIALAPVLQSEETTATSESSAQQKRRPPFRYEVQNEDEPSRKKRKLEIPSAQASDTLKMLTLLANDDVDEDFDAFDQDL